MSAKRMPAAKRSQSNESEFEIRFSSCLKTIFGWLPPGSIQHQRPITFKAGHKTHIIRPDIILHFNGTPLAVLELKKPGILITSDDQKQVLSYSKLLTPPPPLTIISNGSDTLFLETHSGNPWVPASKNEESLFKLIQTAALASENAAAITIETLSGTSPDLWKHAFRDHTTAVLASITTSPSDITPAFVSNFLIPRKATDQILEHLHEGNRCIILTGPPLCGKSSVLRELIVRMSSSAVVVLLIQSTAQTDIYRSIATILSDRLGWSFTAQDARAWLTRVSNSDSENTSILMLVDEIRIDHLQMRNSLDDLYSPTFGSQVSTVLSIDDSIREYMLFSDNGRTPSTLSRHASPFVIIEPLDDDEFAATQNILSEQRISIMPGGSLTAEFRYPWIIRSILMHCTSDPIYQQMQFGLLLPSLFSVELIRYSRERFTSERLREQFFTLAKAVIADAEDTSFSKELMIEFMDSFAVRRETLLQHSSPVEIRNMIEHGTLKLSMLPSGEAIFHIGIPHLLASELSFSLSNILLSKLTDDSTLAASWLSSISSRLPWGDVIAAQSIIDVQIQKTIPVPFIDSLLASKPLMAEITPDQNPQIRHPNPALAENFFDDTFPGYAFSNIHSWLILSHLALHPCFVEIAGTTVHTETRLLEIVGSNPFLLRNPETGSIPVHNEWGGEISFCETGIIEPITLSILTFIKSDHDAAERWILKSIEVGSPFLLNRIYLCVNLLSGMYTHQEWSSKILKQHIFPALRQHSFPGFV